MRAAASGGLWCIANHELGHLPSSDSSLSSPPRLLSPSEIPREEIPSAATPACASCQPRPCWGSLAPLPCAHGSSCQHPTVPQVPNKAQRWAGAFLAQAFPGKPPPVLLTSTPGALPPVVMPKEVAQARLEPQEAGTPAWMQLFQCSSH